MKNFKSLKVGLVLLLASVCGVAMADFYTGYNPLTLLNGTPGLPVAIGPVPVLSGSGCGTLASVQATQVGGLAVSQFASQSTACTLTVTLPAVAVASGGTGAAAPAPNGLFCVAIDETHPANIYTQTAHTTTSCTIVFAATTSADKILLEINGF